MPGALHDRDGLQRNADKMEDSHTPVRDDTRLAKLAAIVRDRPWAFAVVRLIKNARTRIAILLAIGCVAEALYFRERPLSLARPNVWVVVALFLIAGGLAFRLAALGCIRKKERLATRGVYSLCRHPLYLGSILLAYGFCALLGNAHNFVWATVYFIVFYPLTIYWEEVRLGTLYGKTHTRYSRNTPTLLPLGAFRSGAFAWQAAMSQGGVSLLVAVVTLLVSVQVMAVTM